MFEIKKNFINTPNTPLMLGKYEGIKLITTDKPWVKIEEFINDKNNLSTFTHFIIDDETIMQLNDLNYASGVLDTSNVYISLCEVHDHVLFRRACTRLLWLVSKLLLDNNLTVSNDNLLVDDSVNKYFSYYGYTIENFFEHVDLEYKELLKDI
jgi:hypothetical protein